jgi:hypothetical protein
MLIMPALLHEFTVTEERGVVQRKIIMPAVIQQFAT